MDGVTVNLFSGGSIFVQGGRGAGEQIKQGATRRMVGVTEKSLFFAIPGRYSSWLVRTVPTTRTKTFNDPIDTQHSRPGTDGEASTLRQSSGLEPWNLGACQFLRLAFPTPPGNGLTRLTTFIDATLFDSFLG